MIKKELEENVVRFREDEGPKKSRGVKPQEIKKWKKEESEEKEVKENDESKTNEKKIIFFLRFTCIILTLVSFFSALDDIIQSKDSYVFSYMKYKCLQSCNR